MTSVLAISVRLAVPEDGEHISRLSQEALEEQSNYRGAVADIANSPEALLAIVEGNIFGVLSFCIEEPATAVITLVHVDNEAREVGIGDALVTGAIELFRKRKIAWVSATAQPGDRSLKNLFERHGLVAQRITVGKALNGPSTVEPASQ